MSKRRATTELNHDNWDREDQTEKEEAGSFKPLLNVQDRVIRKAKRTLLDRGDGDKPRNSPFSGFCGFAKKVEKPTFSFTPVTKVETPPGNKESISKNGCADEPLKVSDVKEVSSSVTSTQQASKRPCLSSDDNKSRKKSLEYFKQLQMLNESLMRWMQLHLSRNPCCDFTPVFADYRTHLKKLEKLHDAPPEKLIPPRSSFNDNPMTSSSKHPEMISYQPSRTTGEKESPKISTFLFEKGSSVSFAKSSTDDFGKSSTDSFGKSSTDSFGKSSTDSFGKTSTDCFGKSSTDCFGKSSGGHFGKSSTDSCASESKEDDPTKSEMAYGAGFSANTTNTSTFSFGFKSSPFATSTGSPTGPTSSSLVKPSKEDDKETNETLDKKDTSSSCSGSNTLFKTPFQKTELPQTPESKPFTFASYSSPMNNSASAKDGNEDEYVPPKNVVETVREEDAVYSKRCKLFFKKEESYVEKGVGMLYLKKIDDKMQLLVRADTNLGNILLNIMLSASLPMQRTGKNNVLIVCVPNPPVETKKKESEAQEAIPLLFRVKTSEDADELLETLNKYKI